MQTIATNKTLENLVKNIARHCRVMPYHVKVDGSDVFIEGVKKPAFSVRDMETYYMFRLDTNFEANQRAAA